MEGVTDGQTTPNPTINNTYTNDDIPRKSVLPILTQENHELWFRLLKTHLQARGGTKILDTEEENFVKGGHGTKETYQKHSGYALTLILGGLDRADLRSIRNEEEVKKVVELLKKKYIDHRTQVATSKQRELMTFKKKENQTIQQAWDFVNELVSDIEDINPKLAFAYPEEQLMHILLNALPDEYTATADALKGRESLKVMEGLRILKDKEDLLKASREDTPDVGLWAKKWVGYRDSSHDNKHSNSKGSYWRRGSPDAPKRGGRTGCYLCEKPDHQIGKCPHLKSAQALVQSVLKEHKHKIVKKGRAYEANSDDDDDYVSSEEIEKIEIDDEVAALTIEAADKLSLG